MTVVNVLRMEDGRVEAGLIQEGTRDHELDANAN